MLVSDKYQFIVACPTKTGTNSMRAVVEKWKRAGGRGFVVDLLTGEKATRHRVAPPPGKEHYTRYMMVRQPEARLVSMYEYLRRKDWEWGAPHILASERVYGRRKAWIELLRLIAAMRDSAGYHEGGRRAWHGKRPYMWTDTQTEMMEYLSGIDADGSELSWGIGDVVELKLEDIDFAWRDLLDRHDVEEDELYEVEVSHRNSSPVAGRLFEHNHEYWSVDGASSLMHEYREADEWTRALYRSGV